MAADEEIILDIKVNGDKDIKKSVDALKTLKTEVKSLKSEMLATREGTAEYAKLAGRLGELQDKLSAVNESSKNLAGNGIENVRTSFASLSNAFQTFDVSKISTSFKTLGAAINGSTIILTAIIAVITYVVQNFDELSKKAGLLGQYLRLLAAAFEWVSDKISEFTDWLGLTNNALEKSTAKTIEAHTKQLASLTDRYDKEIELSKKAGKDVTEIEIKKSNAIIDNARLQLNAIKALAEANGMVSDEQMKQIEALSKLIKDSGANINNVIAEQQAKQHDKAEKDNKEHLEKLKSALKEFADFQIQLTKSVEDEKAKTDQQKLELAKQREIDQLEAKLKILKDNGVKQNTIEDHRLAALALIKEKYNLQEQELLAKKAADADAFYMADAEKAIKKAEDEKALKEKADLDFYASESDKALKADKNRNADLAKQKQTFTQSLQGAAALNNSLMALSDGIYAAKAKNLTKGSAAEKAVLKKQFEVSKGFQIAQATITGIQSALNIFQSLSIIPVIGGVLGGIAAAAVGVSTALQIKKIASTKFDDGGSASGSDTSVSTPSIPTASTPPPVAQTPNMNLTSTGESSNKTLSGDNSNTNSNNGGVFKTFVVESDITDSQKRQAAIDRRSTL